MSNILFKNEKYKIEKLISNCYKLTELPFIRIILFDKKQAKILLLQDEFSSEVYGYFLPSKIIFKTMDEYDIAENLIEEHAVQVFKKYIKELGYFENNYKLYKRLSDIGRSQIFYYEVNEFRKLDSFNSNKIKKSWLTFDEIIELTIQDSFYNIEDVAILLTYILEYKKEQGSGKKF